VEGFGEIMDMTYSIFYLKEIKIRIKSQQSHQRLQTTARKDSPLLNPK